MNGLVVDRTGTFGRLSYAKIFIIDATRFFPLPFLEFIYNHMPGLGLDLVKRNRKISHEFARQLVTEKVAEAADGKGRHDVMSILGKLCRN